MSVDAGENHLEQDRYNLYVEGCLKKNIKPLGPKLWSKRERLRDKAILKQVQATEDKEKTERINIEFLIMMRMNGVARNLDLMQRAMHHFKLGRDQTLTWNNDAPKACPLCNELLCPWAT